MNLMIQYWNVLILLSSLHSGHEQIVDLLIKKGAFINAVNNIGNSALRVAAIEGRDAVVRLLLQNGADPIIKNVNGDATNVANFRGIYGSNDQISRKYYFWIAWNA